MKWATVRCPRIVNIAIRFVARICGLENILCFDPGADGPGFMLSPAPQAEADSLCKAYAVRILNDR